MNQNRAGNYCSKFLKMSCVFVPLFCQLSCSMFSDDEGCDEELDDFLLRMKGAFSFMSKSSNRNVYGCFLKHFYM